MTTVSREEMLAQRIKTNPLGWLPGVGECINITFTPDEAQVLVAALSLAAKSADDDVWKAIPDDIRALGWMVAVHNDYRQLGEPHTFWLFTKGGLAVKGEGMSDAEALNKVRAAILALSTKAKP